MRIVQENCDWCGADYTLPYGEYRRKLRLGTSFFCSISCAASCRNELRGNKKVQIIKTCPVCAEEFKTWTGSKSSTFCSRSCASKGSVTKRRREQARKIGKANLRHDPELVATALRSRESWKYVKLHKLLKFAGEVFVFEFPVGHDIFDLALPAHRLLVEFDGIYHRGSKQKTLDAEKTANAERLGWSVTRIDTPDNRIIEPDVLHALLKQQ